MLRFVGRNFYLLALAGAGLVLFAKAAHEGYKHRHKQEEEKEESNQANQDKELLKQELEAEKQEIKQLKEVLRDVARRLGHYVVLSPELDQFASMTDAEIYGTDA